MILFLLFALFCVLCHTLKVKVDVFIKWFNFFYIR